MTKCELKMNTKCTKLTRKRIWCQCDSLWHRDYVHMSQIMIMWLIIPLICSWVNDRRSVISNSKKSFKNNPLLDSLENGGLMGTRALVPSLFDVPFLWCSISKKIEMTWTRKFRVENFVFSFSQFWMIPTRSCLLIRNFGFKEKIKVVRTGGFTVHPFSGPETEIFSRKKFKNDFRTRRINWTNLKRWTRKIGWSKMGIHEVGDTLESVVGNIEKFERFKLEIYFQILVLSARSRS